MDDLEVRQLRYFVAVAEELHFGRAAERLGIAQPALSRTIATVERTLGVALLERTTRRVALTPAGEGLLLDARAALAAVRTAGQRARHAGRPEATLRLAMKADFDAGMLPAMLAAYGPAPGLPPVELALGGRGEQVPALQEGRADVAILPGPVDEAGLDTEVLLTEPRLLALGAGDPLLDRPELRLADLAGRTLPDGRRAELDGRGDPTGLRRGLDLAQIFNLVELGSVVWFAPLSVAERHPRSGVAYRRVLDLAPGTLVLAWRQDSRSPAVAAFVRAAVDVAESRAAGP